MIRILQIESAAKPLSACSYNYVANNVRRLTHTCYHLIPKLDETPEYAIHVILILTSLFHPVFLFFSVFPSQLSDPHKQTAPSCLLTNSQLESKVNSISLFIFFLAKSTYVANRPHPIALTHILDCTSDLCIMPVHHFYSC